jgi:hypothetical protein
VVSEPPDSDDLRGAARLAFAGAMAVIAAFVAGKAARDAILLANFAVTSLPLFVGISAMISLPLVVIAGRLIARYGPGRLIPAVFFASAGVLVGEWFLLAQAPRAAAMLTYFHLSTLGAILVSGFWSIINERFDARSAKRHIGRIGVGATLGGIAGGLVAERTAVYLEPGAILLVLAALQLGCAIGLRLLAGRAAQVAPPEPVEPGQTLAAFKLVAGSKLLRTLAIIIVLGAIGAAALDYVFKAEVVGATTAASRLRFFALFYTATSLITAIVQLTLSRAVVTNIGVARGVAALPGAVTAFGAIALAFPGLWSKVIARAAELVVRSSVYRAAYELIYAPLPEADKRSTKVVLDVGGERIGDLVGAQIVAAIIYLVPTPQPWLLVCALIAGSFALCFALILPRHYTAALEQSLLVRAEDQPEAAPEPRWSASASQSLTETGELTSLSMLDVRQALPRVTPAGTPVVGPPPMTAGVPITIPPVLTATPVPRREPTIPPRPAPDAPGDELAARLAELRSSELERVRRALDGELPIELARSAIALLGWDGVAPLVARRLRALAPRCTGLLADALLDPDQEFAIRRRLPAILAAGDPQLAAWALWRGLGDARFEVRYRCGQALARIKRRGKGFAIVADDVFAVVKTELSMSRDVWQAHQVIDGANDSANENADDAGDDGANGHGVDTPVNGADAEVLLRILRRRSATGLDHVFTLLGLVLPAEPIRIAFQGLYTDDRALRATSLEYLDSVLPAEIRDLLWPLVEGGDAAAFGATRRSEELAAQLTMSLPSIVANLRQLAARSTR